MDIKYPIENKYMKCVLQINGFSVPHPRVWSSRRVGSGIGGKGGQQFILVSDLRFRRFCKLIFKLCVTCIAFAYKG